MFVVCCSFEKVEESVLKELLNLWETMLCDVRKVGDAIEFIDRLW